MIDADGYRPNVGLIIFNDEGKLLWAKRIGQEAWQFPQGGIQRNEQPRDAALRELHAEVGLTHEDIEVVAATSSWLHYELPPHLIRQKSHPVCIGQKQLWFLLRLVGDGSKISFDKGSKAEFDNFLWIDYWEAPVHVVEFKRNVYKKALDELQVAYNKAMELLRN